MIQLSVGLTADWDLPNWTRYVKTLLDDDDFCGYAGAGALRPPGPVAAPLASSLRAPSRPVPPRTCYPHSELGGSPDRFAQYVRAYRIASLAPLRQGNHRGGEEPRPRWLARAPLAANRLPVGSHWRP